MGKLNALWWWIDRWRKSTAYTDMTLEEQGAYRNLLDEAQLRGGALPNDQRTLSRACGDPLAWDRVREKVMARFELRPDGCWHNGTLDEVLRQSEHRAARQRRYRERQRNAGRNGGRNAARNTRHNEGVTKGVSPSPSPSPSFSERSYLNSLRGSTENSAARLEAKTGRCPSAAEVECIVEDAVEFSKEPDRRALYALLGRDLGRTYFDRAVGRAKEIIGDIERRGQRVDSRGAVLVFACREVAGLVGIELQLAERAPPKRARARQQSEAWPRAG